MWRVDVGDCVEMMSAMPEASVDAVVCDPPYELAFMGRAWDQQGVAYDPATWREVLRVLKPGGHLLAFGGTRTFHRMTVAVEDAGFEVRDCLSWLYGSGFPKSHNVAGAIDKMRGAPNRGRAIPAASTHFPSGRYAEEKLTSNPVGEYEAASDESKPWQGWGTALKPSWEPIIVARKPFKGTVAANVLAHGTGGLNIDGCRVGTGTQGRWPANTVLAHTPDCERVGDEARECVPDCPVRQLDEQSGESVSRIGKARSGTPGDGWGIGTQVGTEYADRGGVSRFFATFGFSIMGECSQPGAAPTEAANMCVGSSKANSIDSSRTAGSGNAQTDQSPADMTSITGTTTRSTTASTISNSSSAADTRRITPRSAQPKLSAMGNEDARGAANGRHSPHSRVGPKVRDNPTAENAAPHTFESGAQQTASITTPTCANTADDEKPRRFFYTSKASRKEREAGLKPDEATTKQRANTHPTVKPIDLMRWLVRLVTPPAGVVLDPFTGSGTTGCAAVLEGFDFIGIEREPEYVQIACARIAYWERSREPGQLALVE